MGEENPALTGKSSLMPMAAVSARFGGLQMALDALSSDDPDIVFMAAQAVYHASMAQKTQAALKPLVQALGNDNDPVRWAAALALGGLGDRRAVKPLVDRLADGNLYVRVAVADALGKIADPYAVEAIAASLDIHKEGSAYVRAAAARALGAVGGKCALRHLLESLKNEDNALVVLAISGALGRFDEEMAIGPLIKHLDLSVVNTEAAASLGMLKRHLAESQVLDMVYMLKNGHSYQLRASCALAIGEIGWEGTSGYLIEAAGNDGSMAVRWAVAKTLGKSADQEEALRLLIALLKGGEAQVSEAALESVLVLTVDDRSPVVSGPRSAALEALDDDERLSAAIEAAENRLKLAAYMGTPEDKERRMRSAKKKSCFDLRLREMEETAGMREALKRIESLEGRGGAAAVESLVDMLGDENGHVRKAASDSLERLLRKARSPDVDAALDDPSSADRFARLSFAAKRFMEPGHTMMFHGKMTSRNASKNLPTVMDIPGKGKTQV